MGTLHEHHRAAGEPRNRSFQRNLPSVSRQLAKFDLIILDEMGIRKFTATEAQDLCEIIEERSIDKSVAFTSQLPVDHWNEVIPDTVIFDAIRDRLEHSALTINITGDRFGASKT